MKKTFVYWKPNITVRNYAKKQVENMKYLNVAEKHDAAKTIAGFLSNGTARRREGFSVYNKVFDFEAEVKGKNCKMVMTSVSGHLLSLEFLMGYRNWKAVDPKSLFEAPVRKACSQDFQPIKRTLEREIRSCQGLIIWTDCDREGENIGFEIIDVCRAIKPNIVVYRGKFSEITKLSVRRALQQLVEPDKKQSDAVDVRTELDLRTGAAITRFQTMRLQRLFPAKIADKLISYGSCQIPTLGFVVERYKEVEAFVSEPFWKIKVIHTIEDLTVEFNWARNRLFDKQACEDYFLLCIADPKAKVEKVTVKPKNKWRPTPMDTVDMEKLGSRKLKLSAKETMTIAEKLYTKGLISYPRTETNQFSKEFDIRTLVEQQTQHSVWGSFAQRVMEWGPNPRNGNKSDQAHPPIHPTKMVTDLQGNEAKIYELVCRHFLACVSKDAVGMETIVNIDIAGEKFHANGLCIHERNYLDVYIYDKWNAKQIHNYIEGQEFDPTEITMPEGATTAPPLLTEADLISLMEKHGIGTDATHADHINTIKERGYIGVVDNGFLVPGVIGMGLYEGYDAMQLVLAKPVLRAEFEADLKKICTGDKNPNVVLKEQIKKYQEAYGQIIEKITAMDEKIALRINETPSSNTNATTTTAQNSENTNVAHELFQCPKCNNAKLALRQKKNQVSFFIGCMNFPDCKHYIGIPDEFKEPTVPGETCPKCGNTVKLLKFKFQSAYLKTLFNAPHGWYKTCLICDTKLQTTFNINLDSVKRLGSIVSDDNSQSNTSRSTNSLSSSSNDRISAQLHKTRGDSKRTTVPKNPKRTTKNNLHKDEDKNLRNYFTAAGQSNQKEIFHESPLNDFFDSNDDLDLLLVAEGTIGTAVTSSNALVAGTVTSNLSQSVDNDIAAFFGENDDDDDDFFSDVRLDSNLHRMDHPVDDAAENPMSFRKRPAHIITSELEDSFRAIYRDDEVDFSEFSWGTAQRKQRSSEIVQLSKKPRNEISNNFDTKSEKVVEFKSSEQTVKCDGCHQPAKIFTVRKEGLNKGREFYVCSKSEPCKYFQWADELPSSSKLQSGESNNQPSSFNCNAPATNNNVHTNLPKNYHNAEEDTKCNCGINASSLIVRKEGPNKGRSFWACSNRDKSCGFFQWGDENATTSTGLRSSNDNNHWGSGPSGSKNKSVGSQSRRNEQSVNKARKCGLCRQEGHTKQKCPRKNEFTY